MITAHVTTPAPLTPLCLLIWHVDAEFGWRDKVFPRTLCDYHTRLLVEHGSDLWRWVGSRDLFGCLRVLAALEIVGHVAIFPQKGEKLQQKVAEVFADAKPPWSMITTVEIYFFSNMEHLMHAKSPKSVPCV